MELDFRERYEWLQREVAEAARTAGRSAHDIRIVAVTKTQLPEMIGVAIEAGVTDIAENYLQEARDKFARVAFCSSNGGTVRKHFIGHVQTNKAKAIALAFDVVQSVDRLDAGRALARAAIEAGKTLRVLVQINISPNERFGCAPAEARGLAEALRALPGLAVEGLMAIGPLGGERGETVRAFETAAKTFERVGGSILSIGMSGDWREAVACGSTMIRVGTALFGQRPAPAGMQK